MIKVAKKYYNMLFLLLMTSITTFIMSFILTFINLGITENLHLIWLRNWLTAFVIVYPLLLFLSPKVRNFWKK